MLNYGCILFKKRQCGPPYFVYLKKPRFILRRWANICLCVFSVKMFKAAYIIFKISPLHWLFNFLLVPVSSAKSASNYLKMILKFSYLWNGAQCKGRMKIKNEVTMLFSVSRNKNAAEIVIKMLVLLTVKPPIVIHTNISFAKCQGSWLYAKFITLEIYWKLICASCLSRAGNQNYWVIIYRLVYYH